MNAQDIEQLFRKTLGDRRMSRGERKALSQLLDQLDPSEQTLTVFRNVAFKLASEAVNTPQDRAIVEWLEEAVKLLQAASQTSVKPTIAEAHFSPQDNCLSRINGLLGAAKSRVDICVFTITDDRIAATIIDAHRRGVTVRIITDDDKSQDLGSDIDRLAAAGIEVRVDRSQFHMHHKYGVFDRKILLTGSFNWTRSASQNNEENFIITDDRRLVRPFVASFEDLWAKFA
ncbi:MAG: phospholipase D-like domain-containing protein [Planctomycetota bacterium]|nr:phospholipase D-like domain-containing protein [Planctomycetota bacterium]